MEKSYSCWILGTEAPPREIIVADISQIRRSKGDRGGPMSRGRVTTMKTVATTTPKSIATNNPCAIIIPSTA